VRREGGDNGKDWCLCVFGCLWEMETAWINGGNLWLSGSVGKFL